MIDLDTPEMRAVFIRVRAQLIEQLNGAPESERPAILRALRLLYDPGKPRPPTPPRPPKPELTPSQRYQLKRKQPVRTYEEMKEIRRRAERRRKLAWLLRVRGLTYKRIGERLGISKDRAHQLVMRYSYYLNGRLKARHTKFYFLKLPDLL